MNNTGCQSSPKPCSGTVSRLHNLYPRSTQNTDVVSSINFPNLSVNYPFILLFNSVKNNQYHVTRILERCGDNNSNSTVTITV